MRIGELASRAGVNVQTIRFYERRRLLSHPPRTPSGYRSYSQTDFEALQFIRWAQQLGFTLKEVKQLLQLHTAVTNLPSADTRRDPVELDSIIKMAEEKLAAVHEKIGLLKSMGKQLSSTIEKLRRRPEPVCPASKPHAKSPRPA
jgi:MerR family transcriptional regulator, mercuric resistance operon regulatory protein